MFYSILIINCEVLWNDYLYFISRTSKKFLLYNYHFNLASSKLASASLLHTNKDINFVVSSLVIFKTYQVTFLVQTATRNSDNSTNIILLQISPVSLFKTHISDLKLFSFLFIRN